MKITYTRTGIVETHYKDEWDLEISAEELALIKAGQHPDYETIEEWADDIWEHDAPPTRSKTQPGEVYDGNTTVCEAAQ